MFRLSGSEKNCLCQALSGDSTPMFEGMSFRGQSRRRQGMEIHLAAKTRVIDVVENTKCLRVVLEDLDLMVYKVFPSPSDSMIFWN